MKKRPFDLPQYLVDFVQYKNLNSHMFWFQKFRGKRWIYGQNFGDYLSFVIVGELLKRKGLLPLKSANSTRKLLALGSVMHFANDNDIVWGSGVNGKMSVDYYKFNQLDVRMVRGPLTQSFIEQRGITVPDSVFGDPALLLPELFPNLRKKTIPGLVTVLPNLNEFNMIRPLVPKEFKLLSPIGYWKNIVKEILKSELLLTSSLHGLIVAEIFGVPVRFVGPSGGETLFKYKDYLEGTGRTLSETPNNFLDGVTMDMGVGFPSPKVDVQGMISAFPDDFFSKEK